MGPPGFSLGRGQVVRQRTLNPCTVGSNPTAPAFFSCLTTDLRGLDGHLGGLGIFQTCFSPNPLRSSNYPYTKCQTFLTPSVKLSLHELSNFPYRQVARFVVKLSLGARTSRGFDFCAKLQYAMLDSGSTQRRRDAKRSKVQVNVSGPDVPTSSKRLRNIEAALKNLCALASLR